MDKEDKKSREKEAWAQKEHEALEKVLLLLRMDVIPSLLRKVEDRICIKENDGIRHVFQKRERIPRHDRDQKQKRERIPHKNKTNNKNTRSSHTAYFCNK